MLMSKEAALAGPLTPCPACAVLSYTAIFLILLFCALGCCCGCACVPVVNIHTVGPTHSLGSHSRSRTRRSFIEVTGVGKRRGQPYLCVAPNRVRYVCRPPS